MKKNLFIAAAVILSWNLAASDFVLVRDKRPQCTIIMPEKPPKTVSLAVLRFNRALKTITGTALPVVKRDVPGNRITLAVRKPDSLLTLDDYTISFPDARTLRIEGSTASVQWAFNHIIREFAKAEWILIESCGLSYIPMKDLVIPARKIEHKNVSWPVYRSYTHAAAWWMLNYQNQFRVGHDLTYHAFPYKKYEKDNSWPKAVMPVLNGKKITAPPMPKSPENFWQPCYSNPETAKIAVENLLEYLKNKPDTLNISLGCNDNAGYCECAECLKMDKNRRYNRSESYFTFINRVMAVIGKKYPKLLVSAFAYDRTYLPPSFKLHPNVLVSLCIDFNSCVEPRMLAKHKKAISEWSQKASMLGVWDYSWGFPYPAPRLYAPHHLDMLKYLYEHKGRGYGAECLLSNAAEGPKQYLVAKFLWDSKQDMKKVEEDWYIRCVGKKAAPYLKAYFKVWNDYFTGRVKLTPWFKTVFNTYMNFGAESCVYGLRGAVFKAASEAMKKVVELAETAQEKERAELMARHCRYTLLRLRMLGAGVYNPDGSVTSAEQALKLLDVVIKYPEYLKQYQQISEIFKRDPDARATYLNPYYLRTGGSPAGRNFDIPMNSHISAAASFAKHPGVAAKMLKIAADPRQNDQIRQMCKALADPSKQKNLLPGGNAENGIPEMFEIHPQLQRYGELAISEKYRAEGKKSFRISVKGHDTLLWIQVPAKPFTTYLATFKAFMPKPSAEGFMETNLYAQKNGRNQQYRQPPPQKLAGGIWETFAIQTATRINSDSIRLRIHFRKFEKGDEIYLDEIRIMEIGPVSAARKPAAKKNAAPAAKKF